MNVERIRDLCRERGTNLKQLEVALGFGNGSIAKWERQNPSVLKAKAVADFFGITVEDLIREEGENGQ